MKRLVLQLLAALFVFALQAGAYAVTVPLNDFWTNTEGYSLDNSTGVITGATPGDTVAPAVFSAAENAPGSFGGACQFNYDSTIATNPAAKGTAARCNPIPNYTQSWEGFDAVKISIKVPASYTGVVTGYIMLQAGAGWEIFYPKAFDSYANDGAWHEFTVTRAEMEAANPSYPNAWKEIRGVGMGFESATDYSGPVFFDKVCLESSQPVNTLWDFKSNLQGWELNTGYNSAAGIAWSSTVNFPYSIGGAAAMDCDFVGRVDANAVCHIYGGEGMDMTGIKQIGMYVKGDSTLPATGALCRMNVIGRANSWSNTDMYTLYPDTWQLVLWPADKLTVAQITKISYIEIDLAGDIAYTGKFYVDGVFVIGDCPYSDLMKPPPAPVGIVSLSDFEKSTEGFLCDMANGTVTGPETGTFIATENAPGSFGGANQVDIDSAGGLTLVRKYITPTSLDGFDSIRMSVRVPASFNGTVATGIMAQAWKFVYVPLTPYVNDGEWHELVLTKAALEAQVPGGWSGVRSFGPGILPQSPYYAVPVYIDKVYLGSGLPVNNIYDFTKSLQTWTPNTGYSGTGGLAWASGVNYPSSSGGAAALTCNFAAGVTDAACSVSYPDLGGDMTGTMQIGMYVKGDATLAAGAKSRMNFISNGVFSASVFYDLSPDCWTLLLCPASLLSDITKVTLIEADLASATGYTGKFYVDRVFLLGDSPLAEVIKNTPEVNSTGKSWMLYN